MSIPQKKDFLLYKSGKILNYISLEVKKNRMPNYLDIVKGRSSPGILIVDPTGSLTYANATALEYFPGLRRGKLSADVSDLCRDLQKKPGAPAGPRESAACLVVDSVSGFPFSLRAFPIAEKRSRRPVSYIMVLIEKIVDRHLAELDFEGVGRRYGLSKREVEVLELISRGLSNLEIAGRLFISEYTVKDHIKRILSKMDLPSRSGIIASLLQPLKK